MSGSRDSLATAAISSTAAGVLSAATMAIIGKLLRNNAVGPLHGPSQWFWGECGARECSHRVRRRLRVHAQMFPAR